MPDDRINYQQMKAYLNGKCLWKIGLFDWILLWFKYARTNDTGPK